MSDDTLIRAKLQTIKYEVDQLLKIIGRTETTSNPGLELNFSLDRDQEEIPWPRVIEGFFNGEKFVGGDEREYFVPPNYASKSKLVLGDKMKLTITNSGSFIYKQIGPTERKRLIGKLSYIDETNRWIVKTSSAEYRVLPASISFYKGKPGDEVVVLVPESTPTEWATVDQLIAH